MNRLSEETLEPVTAKLRETYRGYSTTEVSEAIWQATSAICVHEKQVTEGGEELACGGGIFHSFIFCHSPIRVRE